MKWLSASVSEAAGGRRDRHRADGLQHRAWRRQGYRGRRRGDSEGDQVMQKFTPFTASWRRSTVANVDTDAIIHEAVPEVDQRTGFGPYLFDEWRYLEPGRARDGLRRPSAQPEFVLNDPRYGRDHPACARELRLRVVARARALGARGLRLPPADRAELRDIFFNNSFKNGLLPVVLSPAKVDRLFKLATGPEALRIGVDLEPSGCGCPTARRSRSRSTRSASTVCSRGWTTSA